MCLFVHVSTCESVRAKVCTCVCVQMRICAHNCVCASACWAILCVMCTGLCICRHCRYLRVGVGMHQCVSTSGLSINSYPVTRAVAYTLRSTRESNPDRISE